MAPIAILLVEDDEILLALLKNSLEAFYCTVSTAHDAKQAIELLDNTRFDFILTDLQLGASSGLDVVRQAKAVMPKIIIFMMSGCNDPGQIQAAHFSGADYYLIKPFSILSLVEQLHQQGLLLRLAAKPQKTIRSQKTYTICQEPLHPDKNQLYT